MGNISKIPYSVEEDEVLTKLWMDRNFSMDEIVEIMGRSYSSVNSRAKNYLSLEARNKLESKWHMEDVRKRLAEVERI